MTTASKDIIFVGSDSEDEEGPPKPKRGRDSRRGRGRQRAHPSRKPKPSKQLKKAPIIIEDDDSILQEDSLCASDESEIISVSAKDNSASPLRTSEAVDDSATENCVPVISLCLKTARRGLAKRHCEPSTSDSSLLPSHKVSVYSQAVAGGFKRLLQGVSPGGAEASVGDSRDLLVSTETKDTGTELSSINMGRKRTEDQGTFRGHDLTDHMCEVEAETSATSIKIPSPSPPPQSFARRARRMNKTLTCALKALNQAKSSLDKQTTPSKRYRKRDSDVVIVGEEASIKDVVVKVRYLTKVHRIPMKLNEPFYILTKKLSQEINEAEHNLGLFLHDISLEVTETPQSVALSVADIIECHCIKVSEEDSVCASDSIELVIQCMNSRTKTTITANKRRPLIDVINKYAQLMDEEVGSFVFSFDGDDVDPSDTPGKLEMENHDVIDVVYN